MKVALYVDDQLVFNKSDTIVPPVTPPPILPPVTPPPPITPPVTPLGYKEWGVEFQAQVGAGVSVAYKFQLTKQTSTAIMAQVSGGSSETLAIYSFIFPDGRNFPSLIGGNDRIEGMLSTCTLYLRSQANSVGGNVTGQYLPPGDYILQLNAISGSVLGARVSVF